MHSDDGIKLRAIRKQKGLTQEELAQELGISRTMVVALEQGVRDLKTSEWEILQRISSDVQNPKELMVDGKWEILTAQERKWLRAYRAYDIGTILKMLANRFADESDTP